MTEKEFKKLMAEAGCELHSSSPESRIVVYRKLDGTHIALPKSHNTFAVVLSMLVGKCGFAYAVQEYLDDLENGSHEWGYIKGFSDGYDAGYANNHKNKKMTEKQTDVFMAAAGYQLQNPDCKDRVLEYSKPGGTRITLSKGELTFSYVLAMLVGDYRIERVFEDYLDTVKGEAFAEGIAEYDHDGSGWRLGLKNYYRTFKYYTNASNTNTNGGGYHGILRLPPGLQTRRNRGV